MTAAHRTFYRVAGMSELAAQASTLGLVHDVSLPSVTVGLPPLVYGAPFLQHWPVREMPGGPHWRDASYGSYSPWVFTIPDALVHATAGIVCAGGLAIGETLAHADPARDGFTPDGGGVWIGGPVTSLAGTHISVLAAGAAANRFHALIDGVGRLAPIAHAQLGEAAGLLTLPAARTPAGLLSDGVAARWGLAQTAALDRRSVRVEWLVLASMHETTFNYHPNLVAWFDSQGSRARPDPALPAAFYIDRRGAAARRLLNEAELIDALVPLGVVPVALEQMPAAEQIALFRGARLIVAPHGAGLANIVFAQPGCRVIELQMDAYCNWCFRHLAAAKGLSYDCILGRAAGPWLDLAGPVHTMGWRVPVAHVAGAVYAMTGT